MSTANQIRARELPDQTNRRTFLNIRARSTLERGTEIRVLLMDVFVDEYLSSKRGTELDTELNKALVRIEVGTEGSANKK